MAKTRRKARHKQGKTSPNIILRVVESGIRVKVAGHRANPDEIVASKDAKPVFVNRVYTGVNAGKVYPYASTKRGGAPA